MKYFFDTEFIEAKDYLVPISIGIVAEDGREFYAINKECDHSKADQWVKDNVIAQLPPKSDPAWMSRDEIAAKMKAFIDAGGSTPELWAYYASYDWVLFCWLMGGRMLDMPSGWPMAPMDLKQSMVERKIARTALPSKPANAHDALADARWLKEAWATVYWY